MSIHALQTLRCPLDGESLHREAACWRCQNGHSFDIAREGYVNLLPVQHKRSRDPGDSKEMVLARRQFLNAGYYQAIADAVAKAVLRDVESGSLCCLDAGSGEGYYLRELARQAPPDIELFLGGLDISKWAVQAAAKQDSTPAWWVASNANIPVQSNSVDRVLCLFGFPVYAEFARVLRPDGVLLMADPGPNHLRQLREVLYPSLRPVSGEMPVCPPGFAELSIESLQHEIVVEGAVAIQQLLGMTPHFFRASADGRKQATALTRLPLTLDVVIRRLRRND
ncbi:MAG: methyltransferase domain-containing protein [Pseudomonadales bacterium]|nr:methyltransferase domain-containing protein [Pseudomonadales bacterium]